MAKPLDLNMIRQMEGPRPERWIPILCDEIERISADFITAIGIRERAIADAEKNIQELIDDLTALVNRYSKTA